MKHHVFLCVSIFSFSMYAMDRNVWKLNDMIERCRIYNAYNPNTYNIKQLEAEKSEFLKLSDIEQKNILKQMRYFVPKFVEENEQGFVFDWKIVDEKNKFAGINSFYST
jgi:uncharacterized membrane protein YukC